MSIYYTLTVVIAIFSMLAMMVCVNTSGALSRTKRHYFKLLFFSVAVSAFCEWFGIYLQGTGQSTQVLHIVVKALELSIAPAIGFLIASVVEVKYQKAIGIFLAFQASLEVLSGVFGFIYHVDTDSVYTHQSFYWIYMLTYGISIAYAVFIFVRNMKKYQYNGIAFLGMIAICLLFGIIVQTLYSELRIVYIAVAISAVMLYVFTLEMIQQSDELTGLINRRGYENYTAHMEENSMILLFDVDKFKEVNDKYGHPVGDQCLKQIGQLLRSTYAKYGKCFRIGGDEFCVILTKKPEEIEMRNKEFCERLNQCREQNEWMPWVSFGYIFYNPQQEDLQTAVHTADQQMYQYKEAHRNDR